ncbi:MAG: VWA domain-containing protein [Chitinophagales bacterium]
MTNRQTQLSANIVAFCRFLRKNGFNIGIAEEKDALQAMEIIQPYESPEQLQLCLQTALCRTPLQLQKFPKLYHQYWRELDRAVDSKIKEVLEEKEKPKPSNQQKISFQALKNWLNGNRNEEEEEVASYSNVEAKGGGEFPDFDEDELKEVFKWVKKLVDKIANRRSRRFQTTHQKEQIDLKKTIRQNIVRQAEIVNIAYRKKKKNELKVVVLCDVSRSMALYSQFFIQFMFAFQKLFPKVQTFAFSTKLYPISKELTQQSLQKSVKDVIQKVDTWSGGTKIGASLQQFNQEFSHKMLDSKTLVIILSDGWDTGDSELVSENMRFLHRKALKVLWLNPLAGSSDWTPEVVGMKAAMPYIDLLLPFHNLESLERVVKEMRF